MEYINEEEPFKLFYWSFTIITLRCVNYVKRARNGGSLYGAKNLLTVCVWWRSRNRSWPTAPGPRRPQDQQKGRPSSPARAGEPHISTQCPWKTCWGEPSFIRSELLNVCCVATHFESVAEAWMTGPSIDSGQWRRRRKNSWASLKWFTRGKTFWFTPSSPSMSFLKPINYGDTDTGLKTPSSLSRRSDKSITIIIIILHVNADQKRRTSRALLCT